MPPVETREALRFRGTCSTSR